MMTVTSSIEIVVMRRMTMSAMVWRSRMISSSGTSANGVEVHHVRHDGAPDDRHGQAILAADREKQ